MRNAACLFRYMPVAHTLEEGAKRYVDLLSDDSFAKKFPNGSSPMYGYGGCPCLWGARGTLVDNSCYASYFTRRQAAGEERRSDAEMHRKVCRGQTGDPGMH